MNKKIIAIVAAVVGIVTILMPWINLQGFHPLLIRFNMAQAIQVLAMNLGVIVLVLVEKEPGISVAVLSVVNFVAEISQILVVRRYGLNAHTGIGVWISILSTFVILGYAIIDIVSKSSTQVFPTTSTGVNSSVEKTVEKTVLFCGNCGTKIEKNDAIFCPSCGTNLKTMR